jgi:hypothetical protein
MLFFDGDGLLKLFPQETLSGCVVFRWARNEETYRCLIVSLIVLFGLQSHCNTCGTYAPLRCWCSSGYGGSACAGLVYRRNRVPIRRPICEWRAVFLSCVTCPCRQVLHLRCRYLSRVPGCVKPPSCSGTLDPQVAPERTCSRKVSQDELRWEQNLLPLCVRAMKQRAACTQPRSST